MRFRGWVSSGFGTANHAHSRTELATAKRYRAGKCIWRRTWRTWPFSPPVPDAVTPSTMFDSGAAWKLTNLQRLAVRQTCKRVYVCRSSKHCGDHPGRFGVLVMHCLREGVILVRSCSGTEDCKTPLSPSISYSSFMRCTSPTTCLSSRQGARNELCKQEIAAIFARVCVCETRALSEWERALWDDAKISYPNSCCVVRSVAFLAVLEAASLCSKQWMRELLAMLWRWGRASMRSRCGPVGARSSRSWWGARGVAELPRYPFRSAPAHCAVFGAKPVGHHDSDSIPRT